MMKAFTARLMAFAFALGTQAMGLHPQAVMENCSDGQEVASSTIRVNGQEILRQTFICPEGISALAPMSGAQANASNTILLRSALDTRDEILCEFPQNMTECQCGAMFSCVCFQGDVAPGEFDCESLLNSVTAANEGTPTFTVEPNGLEIITLRTCSLAFVNLQNTAVEYCWDNLNFIGEQAWTQCVSDESDRVVGGLCSAANGDYRISLGPVVAA